MVGEKAEGKFLNCEVWIGDGGGDVAVAVRLRALRLRRDGVAKAVMLDFISISCWILNDGFWILDFGFWILGEF